MQKRKKTTSNEIFSAFINIYKCMYRVINFEIKRSVNNSVEYF